MTKNILISALLISSATLFFTGCSKNGDTTDPVITLNGADPVTLALNSNYVDPGATANDDNDGDISSSIIIDDSGVNKDVVGSYTVDYFVSDAAGNIGTATRTVNVINQLTSSAWVGTYNIVIVTPGQSNYTYSDGTVISTTLNNGLTFNKFGDYSNATGKLSFVISGAGTVTIPSQTFTCGTPAVSRTFSGSGVSNGGGASGSTLVLSVMETTNGNTISSTYTCTKQ